MATEEKDVPELAQFKGHRLVFVEEPNNKGLGIDNQIMRATAEDNDLEDKVDVDEFLKQLSVTIKSDPKVLNNLIEVGRFFATKHSVYDKIRHHPEGVCCDDCYSDDTDFEYKDRLRKFGKVLAKTYRLCIPEDDDSEEAVDSDDMDDTEIINVGDVVSWDHDIHENNRYTVEEIKNGEAKVRIISPAETLSDWTPLKEFEKVLKTKKEIQEEWQKRHEYSGILRFTPQMTENIFPLQSTDQFVIAADADEFLDDWNPETEWRYHNDNMRRLREKRPSVIYVWERYTAYVSDPPLTANSEKFKLLVNKAEDSMTQKSREEFRAILCVIKCTDIRQIVYVLNRMTDFLVK
jgi:hypothetical protein